jgi:hypothetical protein
VPFRIVKIPYRLQHILESFFALLNTINNLSGLLAPHAILSVLDALKLLERIAGDSKAPTTTLSRFAAP